MVDGNTFLHYPEHAAVVSRFRSELESADELDLHLVAEVDGVVVGQLDAFMRPQPSQGSMRMPRRRSTMRVLVKAGDSRTPACCRAVGFTDAHVLARRPRLPQSRLAARSRR